MNNSQSFDGDPESRDSANALSFEEFAALLEQHYERLWLIATGITGNRSCSEDLVQEAAITALEKLGTFEPGTNFLAWISRIVRLKALNYARTSAKRATRPADPVLLDDQHAAAFNPATDELDLADPEQLGRLFDDQLCRALDALAETPRTCLLLRTILHLSYAEISEMLEIPEGTAMSHVHRGRQTLRRQLSRQPELASQPPRRSPP